MADGQFDYGGKRDRRRSVIEVQHESDECITVTRVERRRSRFRCFEDARPHPAIRDGGGVGRVCGLGSCAGQRGDGDVAGVDHQARGRANAVRLLGGFINERNLKMFKWIIDRMREPSTWAGLATIAVSLGHAGGAALIGQIASVIVPIIGAVAVVLPETNAADR
jgi:hypothetical protein